MPVDAWLRHYPPWPNVLIVGADARRAEAGIQAVSTQGVRSHVLSASLRRGSKSAQLLGGSDWSYPSGLRQHTLLQS